ncbi:MULTISPECIES: MlaD family protein [Mycolicibacterium]|uniref:MlaD family protein n=1 Tax=Mycolicibacterium TaxID=1866885 RepID=UPI0009F3BEAA|nr:MULTISPECIES: MlaD family protein [Mycolicibacterium]
MHSDAREPVLMTEVVIRPKLRIAFALLTAVATIAGATSCTASKDSAEAGYCAIMPDSVGLYVDNPVTQMGYPVGKVTSITPERMNVRVEFSVDQNRPLPGDVKAVTRSPSLLADRALELVGNYKGGPRLVAGSCIGLDRSVTPKSLSQVIGSATNFLNAISPEDSTNIGDTVRGIDQLAHNNGAPANQLLTNTSALLDSPDKAISDIGSIMNNLAQLTTTLKDIRSPMKEALLDAVKTTPDMSTALEGTFRLALPLAEFLVMTKDLEVELGEETQLTLDTVSATVRKLSPHANKFADLLNPVPWWINTAANHFNRRQFHTFNIAYRPPMFRIPTHNGLALCGFMNASTPGSCADVHGQPYAVDVALLQYVLTQANR